MKKVSTGSKDFLGGAIAAIFIHALAKNGKLHFCIELDTSFLENNSIF